MEGEIRSFGKRIRQIRDDLFLVDEELISYAKASKFQSDTGSTKLLDAIPKTCQEKIGEFYKRIRKAGVFSYDPETKKIRVKTSYIGLWVDLKRSSGRPEFASISGEEIKKLLANSIAGVKERMGIKDRSFGSNSIFFDVLKNIPNEQKAVNQ